MSKRHDLIDSMTDHELKDRVKVLEFGLSAVLKMLEDSDSSISIYSFCLKVLEND